MFPLGAGRVLVCDFAEYCTALVAAVAWMNGSLILGGDREDMRAPQCSKLDKRESRCQNRRVSSRIFPAYCAPTVDSGARCNDSEWKNRVTWSCYLFACSLVYLVP